MILYYVGLDESSNEEKIAHIMIITDPDIRQRYENGSVVFRAAKDNMVEMYCTSGNEENLLDVYSREYYTETNENIDFMFEEGFDVIKMLFEKGLE